MNVAFIHDVRVNYPPDFNNMKSYYVTKELRKRGIDVTWLYFGDRDSVCKADDIKLVEIRIRRFRFISTLLSAFVLVGYCKRERINTIYVDDWHFMRRRLLSKLLFQSIIRAVGIRWISDMRDPLVDFEVATGRLREGSLTYVVRKIEERLCCYLSNLIILPSQAYAKLMELNGTNSKKVLGIFRGIDRQLFKPDVDGSKLRERFGIGNSIVLGWFGIMHKYRMIDDLLVPLAADIERIFPDAYLLIGGKGGLKESIVKLVNGKTSNRIIYVGTVPYRQMPEYIAACDVLLCPVSTKSRFPLLSAWLKIPEAVAVGHPVVATRTLTTILDFKRLRGVLWVGSKYEDFIGGIKWAIENLIELKREAQDQALDFQLYSIDRNISRIVDAIVKIAE
jgi:glycosyltransferase involved in cell wall biosynthesis